MQSKLAKKWEKGGSKKGVPFPLSVFSFPKLSQNFSHVLREKFIDFPNHFPIPFLSFPKISHFSRLIPLGIGKNPRKPAIMNAKPEYFDPTFRDRYGADFTVSETEVPGNPDYHLVVIRSCRLAEPAMHLLKGPGIWVEDEAECAQVQAKMIEHLAATRPEVRRRLRKGGGVKIGINREGEIVIG